MKKKTLFFLISLTAIFILIILNISVAKPTNGIFYSCKRLYEKVQLNLISNPKDKLNFQNKLLDNRLAELIFVVGGEIPSGILTSSLRYSTTVGEITELIINNNLKDESVVVRKKLESQSMVLKDLLQKYTKIGDEGKYITDDINYLRIYIDKLTSFENATNQK